uniref:ANK_REP_REGION domain-containing protein n=1 Tax=Panagrellus redivivus TaxID=6233 RepID=A0A7E4W8C5_PANRE
MVHNAEDGIDAMDHQMLQSKMAIANNVLKKRKEQLKEWESSVMNALPPVRRAPDRTKVSFQDSDVFMSACVSGDEEEVVDLLDKGADINVTTIDGVTPLHQAVIDLQIDTIKFLLKYGADINAQDNEGWTPLHAAVCCGNLDIIKILCENGADLSYVNSDKELAIDLTDDPEIREYLENELNARNIDTEECREREFNTMMRDCTDWIRNGRYLDKPHPRTGATALHVAASKGYNQLIGMLIRAGADVNAQDSEGWTPLHAAAHWGEKDACRILLENGAKLSDLNAADQDVLRVADKSIVPYLEEIAAKIAASKAGPAVQPSASANNVLQSTTNPPSVSATTPKRSSVPRLLSTDEKISITKKDEHDENVSLVLGSAPSSPTTEAPPPHTPVSLTVLAQASSTSPPRVTTAVKNPKSGSPDVDAPPAKRVAANSATPETTNAVFRGFKAEKSESASSVGTPSVAAVLPAPRFGPGGDAANSASSLAKSGSASSTASNPSRYSASQPASPSMTSAILATQKPPPAPIRSVRMAHGTSASTSSRSAPLSESEDLEDEAMDEEQPLLEDNTGSGVSSIRTTSRSVSTKDSSSNLYSSDQSVECIVKVPSASMGSTSSPGTTPRPQWPPTSTAASRPTFPHVTASTAAATSRTSPSPTSEASGSPLVSPTTTQRKPVVSNSASAPSSTPWVPHLKTSILSNVGGRVQAFNVNGATAPTPAPAGVRPPPVTAPKPLLTSPAHQQKYTATIRSWQTPPTQPIPQKESEAERKAKSRQQRANRRSTQHVTADQLNEARAASEDLLGQTKWRSTTLQSATTTAPTSTTVTLNNDLRTLPPSSITHSDKPSAITTTATSKRSPPSIVDVGFSDNDDDHHHHGGLHAAAVGQPTPPHATPSANRVRRSQIVRANRRGTGPVDYEALSAASEASHANTDGPENLASRFANVTVRPRPTPTKQSVPEEALILQIRYLSSSVCAFAAS